MMMTDDQAAWLACAIDSEGSLGVYYWNTWPDARIVVNNSSRSYVAYAQALLGNKKIQCHVVRSAGNGGFGKLPMYRVENSNHVEVLAVLKRILPWLIIKRDKALKMIEFIEGRQWGLRGMSKKQLEERAAKTWRTRKKAQEVNG